MAVKFETVKPGEILLDVHSQRVGNTAAREVGVWRVRVISVDASSAVVSWNNNEHTRYTAERISRLRRFAPEWLRRSFPGDLNRRFYCYHCGAQSAEKDTGKHKETCEHPKAVAYRKRAMKAAKR